MDKEWIRKTIEEKVTRREIVTFMRGGGQEYDYEYNYSHAAEAIAQAHEEEVRERLSKWEEAGRDIENQLILEVTQLRARVAELAEGVFYEADVMNGADGRPWIDSNEANIRLVTACKKHLKEGEMFHVIFTKLEEGDG